MGWQQGDPDRRNGSKVIINEAKDSNGSGPKAFGAIVAILAIIGGMAAIILPMNQIIEAQNKYNQETRMMLEDHMKSEGHPGALADISALKERFAEVETQFKWMHDVGEKQDTNVNRRLDILENEVSTHHIQIAGETAKLDEEVKDLQDVKISLSKQGVLETRVEDLMKEAEALDKRFEETQGAKR